MRIQSITVYKTQEDKGNRKGIRGILINDGNGPILDEDGEKFTEVWDYTPDYRLIMSIELDKKGE